MERQALARASSASSNVNREAWRETAASAKREAWRESTPRRSAPHPPPSPSSPLSSGWSNSPANARKPATPTQPLMALAQRPANPLSRSLRQSKSKLITQRLSSLPCQPFLFRSPSTRRQIFGSLTLAASSRLSASASLSTASTTLLAALATELMPRLVTTTSSRTHGQSIGAWRATSYWAATRLASMARAVSAASRSITKSSSQTRSKEKFLFVKFLDPPPPRSAEREARGVALLCVSNGATLRERWRYFARAMAILRARSLATNRFVPRSLRSFLPPTRCRRQWALIASCELTLLGRRAVCPQERKYAVASRWTRRAYPVPPHP